MALALAHRIPRLFGVNPELLDPKTLARIPTHELLPKLGFVSHPKPGLVHWLPMGMLILNRLERLVQKHMNAAGAEQVKLSNLSHASLWQQSGRWGGTELFKLTDSNGHEYCLAPTCEEEITLLVKSRSESYKSFPLLYYQINTKFRDEKRPRSGLLRGKEFIMKDAYSFDVSPARAMKTYKIMTSAYRAIFDELKVPYVCADAATGEIGGSLSHEWHYVHQSGEDTLFECSECRNVLNIEKTLSYPELEQQHDAVSVSYHTTFDKNTLICAYYPQSRDFVPEFLKEEIPDVDLSGSLLQKEILDIFSDEDALISKKIVRIMDLRLNSRSNFPDFPIKFINRSLITTLTDIPLVAAVAGEICHQCEDGHLLEKRAIEVGHTFYLGDKYSDVFNLTVDIPNESGKLETSNVSMGCYGIGISRIIAAIAEISRDDKGLRWPAAIAPWQVTVVNASKDSENEAEILRNLHSAGIEFRVDDREKVRMGKKIRDSNMYGIPLVVIVGKSFPLVEIESRSEDLLKVTVDVSEVGSRVREMLSE